MADSPPEFDPSKPAAVVLGYAKKLAERDAFESDVRQAVDAYSRTFAQVSGHVNEFAMLCRRRGKRHLLAAMPAPVRQPFLDTLAAMRGMWDAVSPHPFPDMPDEPEPVEVV